MNCGGGTPVVPGAGGGGSVAGVAIKGLVVAGKVTAYRLDAGMARGEALGTSTTDDVGAFSITVPSYNGPLLLVVSSGTYTEEAIGLGVKLDGHELSLLVPAFKSGQKLEGLRVTPVSTLAVAFAGFHVRRGDADVAAAWDEALTHLNRHFGNLDWQTVMPADLTVTGVSNLSAEAKAGLVLTGLSYESRLMAEEAGVTPGLTINAATLMDALVRDASDGTLDGMAEGVAQKQARTTLTGATTRTDLVQAMTAFINGPRNASGLSMVDIQAFVAVLGSSNDAYLFCPGQVLSASCGGGLVDTEPPTVTWVRPADGAGVAGSAQVMVVAQDETAVKTFRFTEPASLVGQVAVFEPDGRKATLSANLDVSALPDGPVTVRAEATDGSGNPAAKSIVLSVSNRGPHITISGPSEGVVVKGTALVTASAVAQTGVITKLELVQPPPGVGADTLPAADSFAANWNTAAGAEGLVTLTFRATDSFNSTTESTVVVNVDNVPFGVVEVTLGAGAPIAGASLKLLAIDDATGLPSTRAGGAVLGRGGPTDAQGHASFTLTEENWVGPVQVVASGVGLSYVDPSDGVTPVAVPAAMEFTSFISSYRTGDALVAPVTLWTTLADAAASAYASGKHPQAPSSRPLTAALAVTDPLFSAHISRPATWNLRTTIPVALTSPPTQSLRDVVYAAIPDLALNEAARSISADSNVTPGQVITAVTLAAQLRDDLAGDGRLDGLNGTAPLLTAGSPAYALDANTTRFRMAIELDKFIRGPQNASGLTKGDIMAAGLYGALSSDTSLLYPAGQVPTPFDNAPPVVTFMVTFRGTDGVDHVPVGSGKAVRGVISVTSDAVDATGVASVAVKANGVSLSPTAASPGHFVGPFTTGADGALTLEATSVDTLGNSGTSSLVLTVDNTPPTIAVTNPSSSNFYSAGVPVDVTATDATGLANITQTGFTNLTDADGTAARYAGTWAIPVGQADGLVTATFTACDVLTNCAPQSVSITVDRTAPSLVWAVPPPGWTNALSVPLSVAATDALAGVSAVWFQSGVQPLVSASFDGTAWNASVWTQGASNTITVWAADNALPANSGQALAAPRKLTQVIRRDNGLPVISSYVVPTYLDERGMSVKLNSSGVPLVPVQYQFSPYVTKEALGIPANVFKTALRLSGPAPTSSELNGANAGNTPFLRFGVAYSAGAEAPLAAVTFTATSAAGSATGTLIPSAAAAAGRLYYELPLTSETLPFLYGISTSPVAITLSIEAQDEAGNTGTLASQVVNFHVLGPPVAVQDVTTLPMGNPRTPNYYSTFYASGAQRYQDGFTGAAPIFAGDPYIRLRRFVIYNPNPVPVAARIAEGSVAITYSVREVWKNATSAAPVGDPGVTFTADAFTFPAGPTWSTNPVGWTSSCGSGTTQFPCNSSLTLTNYRSIRPRHLAGSTTEYECQFDTPASASVVDSLETVATAAPLIRGYSSPQADWAETGPLVPLQPGAWPTVRVPSATATQPGSVVLYLVRDAAVARTGRGLVATPYDTAMFAPAFQTLFAYFWEHQWQTCSRSAGYIAETADYWRAMVWYQGLNHAEDVLGGTVNADTWSLGSGSVLVGEPNPVLQEHSISAVTTH